jgi:hypothetical protein
LPNITPKLINEYESKGKFNPPYNKDDINLKTVQAYLQSIYNVAKIDVLGIEIIPPFDTRPSYTMRTLPVFCTPKLVMLGNEGSGMTDKQIDACDEFVVVEQYGGSTASFNVNVAYNVVVERLRERRR